MEKTSAEVMERERKNGMIIMAIRIVCAENKREPFIHSSEIRVPHDRLTLWLGNDAETAKNVMNMCNYLAPKIVAWDIVQQERTNEINYGEARQKFILEIAKRVEYVREKYGFSLEVIKEAIPFGLIDLEKGVCEENFLDKAKFSEAVRTMFESYLVVSRGVLEDKLKERDREIAKLKEELAKKEEE